jgi:hypothetical protein
VGGVGFVTVGCVEGGCTEGGLVEIVWVGTTGFTQAAQDRTSTNARIMQKQRHIFLFIFRDLLSAKLSVFLYLTMAAKIRQLKTKPLSLAIINIINV